MFKILIMENISIECYHREGEIFHMEIKTNTSNGLVNILTIPELEIIQISQEIDNKIKKIKNLHIFDSFLEEGKTKEELSSIEKYIKHKLLMDAIFKKYHIDYSGKKNELDVFLESSPTFRIIQLMVNH